MNELSTMQECPKCEGTTRVALPWHLAPVKQNIPHYDEETDTILCNNCGLQYGAMPTGIVPTNKQGQPCLHKYEEKSLGRCYTEYKCIHCGDRYEIDSSD